MKKFIDYASGKDVLTEVARKSQLNVPPNKKGYLTSIEIKLPKTATGHHSHNTGSGTHDSRPRRQRTRNAQKQTWQKEQSD